MGSSVAKPGAASGRRKVLVIAAALCVMAVMGFAIQSVSRASTPATLQDVSEALTCQCGCGLTVANCNHPQCEFSVPMREQIQKMIDGGMGRAQIIAFFRVKYGEKILSAPTTQGFNLLAWTMPFVALLFGGGLIALTVGRWRSAPPAPPEPAPPAQDGSAEDGSFDPALRSRLTRELRDRI